MLTSTGNRTTPATLLRKGLGISVTASILGGTLLMLSACGGGGGWPMSVEQRYSAPKTQEEILQEKVDAAKRAERAHGSM